MRYAEYRPSPRLAALVEKFWLLEGAVRRALPTRSSPTAGSSSSSTTGLVLASRAPSGDRLRQPASLLVGQMMEPVVLATRDRGRRGDQAATGRGANAAWVCLHEVSGCFVDFELDLSVGDALTERLAEAVADSERMRAARRMADGNGRARRPAARRRQRWRRSSYVRGRAPVSALAARAGTSLRQMERQFQADVGLTPKTFARIVRLQSALRRVRQGRAPQ